MGNAESRFVNAGAKNEIIWKNLDLPGPVTWKEEWEHVWGRGMCPITEKLPDPGHHVHGEGTACSLSLAVQGAASAPRCVLGCVLGCNACTEDAERRPGDVAVMVLVLHVSVPQECYPQAPNAVFISGHTGTPVSLLCVGAVCVDAVPRGSSSWAGHTPGNEAVHCSQPGPGRFVCLAGSP